MGTLTVFVFIAYIFAIPFHRTTQRLRFAFGRFESTFRTVSAGMAVGGFFAVFYIQFLFPGIAGANVAYQYGNGFFNGSSFPLLVANMAISLSGKVGVLLPLIVVGVLRFALKRPKEARDKFLLVVIFAMIPLLSLRDYIAEFLVYVFVILIALAFFPIPRKVVQRNKAAALVLAGLFVASSVAFSWVMKDYWRERYYNDAPVPDDVYSASAYLIWQTRGTVLSNEGMSAGRLAALSNRPVLPIGGASIHWFGSQQLTFGFVNGSRVSVRSVSLTTI